MGYIAPIPHFQYKQYQERELNVTEKPYHYTPVHAITALSRGAGRESREVTDHYNGKEKKQIPEKIIARLTGKGLNFHEYV
ncbi:hypothetical protein ACMG4J_08150 [Rossellomorea marisflavi]|uniref:hypothetical protein n=1 Tax=Rossellomorea marisflavi TaxID=189381 RepID=UPI0039BED5A2